MSPRVIHSFRRRRDRNAPIQTKRGASLRTNPTSITGAASESPIQELEASNLFYISALFATVATVRKLGGRQTRKNVALFPNNEAARWALTKTNREG